MSKRRGNGGSNGKGRRAAPPARLPSAPELHLDDLDFTANMPGAIFQMVREKDGTLRMAFVRSTLGNPAGLAGRGLETVTKNPLASVHEGDVSRVLQALDLSAKDLRPYHLEVRARPIGATPGTMKRIHVSGTPHRLADGRMAWNGVAVDITALKRTEEELKESKRQHDTLMSNLPGMVYRCRNDRDWTIEFVSLGCRELTGYEPADLVASKTVAYNDLIHPEERDWVWEEVQAAVAARRPYRLEYRIRTKEGQEKWVWEQGRGVFAENGAVAALEGFVSDNTERRRLEDEINKAQRLEAIGLLAGGIAHDFNNVLMGVVGNLSLARHGLAAESPARVHLEHAERAANQAAYLTHQLLTFARGGLPVRAVVDITCLLHEAVSFALRGARVRCTFAIDPELWCAYVDRGQIIQVVQNLIINANQAMPDGGTLTLSACNLRRTDSGSEGPQARLEPGEYVHIAIADEGTGIPPEIMPRIFEPFFTTKPEGTGLGLATSHSIVERHGGSLSARSELNRGSVFEICLPARVRASEQPQAERVAPSMPAAGRRVLVMDDDPTVRGVLHQMLQRLGYGVELAAGLGEAMEKCEREMEAGRPFDLALLDLTVPGDQGGAQAVARLRRIDPSIKAIVASGYSRDPVMAEYEKHGFQGVLTKPFKIEQLGDVLEQVLGRCDAAPVEARSS